MRVAINTHLRITAGERAGIRQSEETITETNLLELSVMLPNLRISTHTRKEESRSGADWEWWIEGNTRWFGMLLQAKKLHRIGTSGNSGYGFGYAPQSGNGDLQVDRLILTAEARTVHKLAPVYALYNGTDEPTAHDHCPLRTSGLVSPAAGGITAASAYTVQQLAEAHASRSGRYRDVPLAAARPHAIAWSCLATCDSYCTPAGYESDFPQSGGDAQSGEPDPAQHAFNAISNLLARSSLGRDDSNYVLPEERLHEYPPKYVPTTRDWGGRDPSSPNARHLGVLYRNRSSDL